MPFSLHLYEDMGSYVLQYGLVGSTEWGEDFADWIQAHVVAYLNLGENYYMHLMEDIY